ncbi:hypothetical protein TNCT_636971 [Trichonephila clavata]|uniref:Uncharacterized protein n=1 Tax=Trichonephila clavata TaxID=2740835 RepID=A0A8X6GWG6_TRICU|nr:hypothetical protein TNCT_636971 [Trichonephila clavata]
MPSTTMEQSLGCICSLNKRMLLAIIPEEEQPSHPGGTDSNRRSVQLVTKGLKRTPKTKRKKRATPILAKLVCARSPVRIFPPREGVAPRGAH